MNEQLISYIWQNQLFENRELKLVTGESLVVYSVGQKNENSGPDFSQVRIKIDTLEWVGHVEIHVKSSEWIKHRHDKDPAYEGVVLHVVWMYDKAILNQNGLEIPTLALQDKVDPNWLASFQQFISNKTPLLCDPYLQTIPSIVWRNQLSRMLAERLERKAKQVAIFLEKTQNDWEQTAYLILCRTFGSFVNNTAIEAVAERLPINIIKKNNFNSQYIEALWMGLAGFLSPPFADDYQQELARLYAYLHGKYQLPAGLQRSSWKFAKVRPAGFPTVRISQLVHFLTEQQTLFDMLSNPEILTAKFKSKHYGYWENHYDFGKKSTKPIRPGYELLKNIIINASAPLVAARSIYESNTDLMDKAIWILESCKSERNSIVQLFTDRKIRMSSAADSQSVLQLYTNYCKEKKCLSCSIGTHIIRKK